MLFSRYCNLTRDLISRKPRERPGNPARALPPQNLQDLGLLCSSMPGHTSVISATAPRHPVSVTKTKCPPPPPPQKTPKQAIKQQQQKHWRAVQAPTEALPPLRSPPAPLPFGCHRREDGVSGQGTPGGSAAATGQRRRGPGRGGGAERGGGRGRTGRSGRASPRLWLLPSAGARLGARSR